MDAPFHITAEAFEQLGKIVHRQRSERYLTTIIHAIANADDEPRFHHDLLLVVFRDPAQYPGAVSIPILDRSVTFPVETVEFLRDRQLSAHGGYLCAEELDT